MILVNAPEIDRPIAELVRPKSRRFLGMYLPRANRVLVILIFPSLYLHRSVVLEIGRAMSPAALWCSSSREGLMVQDIQSSVTACVCTVDLILLCLRGGERYRIHPSQGYPIPSYIHVTDHTDSLCMPSLLDYLIHPACQVYPLAFVKSDPSE